MMEKKHTPGPWFAGPVFQKEGRAIFTTDTSKPGKYQKRLDDKSGVFSEDDARLIAAAPDLLAALEKIVNGALRGYRAINGTESAAIFAAIAKARGE